MKKEDIQFFSKAVNKSSHPVQYGIYAEANGENFPVVKFLPSSKLYEHGLEKNYKPLVNMEHLATALALVLSSHAKAGTLNENYYESAMGAFRPFIESRMTFGALGDRIKLAQASNGWVE